MAILAWIYASRVGVFIVDVRRRQDYVRKICIKPTALRFHRYASFNGLKSLSDRVIQAGIVTRYVEATPLWSDRNGQGLCIAPRAADLLELDLNCYGFSRAVGSFIL